MQTFIPGAIAEIGNLAGGDCLLMMVDGAMHVGMVVIDTHGTRSVLDFDHINGAKLPVMQIYTATGFQNEAVLHISGARIVPSIKPADIGSGLHNRGLPSTVLYLTEEGPIVQAINSRHPYKINLTDGSIYQGDIAFKLHCTTWRIECDDGSGHFQTIREFVTATA